MLKLLRVYEHPKQGKILITGIEHSSTNPQFEYFYEWHRIIDKNIIDLKKEPETGYAGLWKEVIEVEIEIKVIFIPKKG